MQEVRLPGFFIGLIIWVSAFGGAAGAASRNAAYPALETVMPAL
jgi:hypothetical protein